MHFYTYAFGLPWNAGGLNLLKHSTLRSVAAYFLKTLL